MPLATEYKNVYWLWMSMAILLLDQITKQLVVNGMHLYEIVPVMPFLNLTRMHNTGAAFSIMSGAPPLFFITLGLAVSIGVLVWLRKHPKGESLMAIALTLILGGALGNVVDRAARGHVVDFIDFYVAGWHWPAFNVADMAIVLGAGFLILDMFLQRDKQSD